MPAYINWRRSRGSRAPEQRDELTSFQPIELHPLPLAKVAASGLASFRSWLAATQYFNPHERRFGSNATDGFCAGRARCPLLLQERSFKA
jgi:hypothetical protein